MDEYITRKEAIDEANGSPFTMSMCLSEQECVGMQRAQAVIAKRLESISAADVVEIIRCKDCIYSDDYHHCNKVNWWTTADDYCSKARRKNNG